MAFLVGAGGAVLFVVVFLLDGLTRPGYSPTRQTVSALALGPRGWIQTANFLVCGASMAAGGSAVVLAGQYLLGALLAVFGLGLVVSGVFRMDPMRGYPPGTPDADPAAFSRQHQLHDHAGAVVFFSLPVTAVVGAFVLPGLMWKVATVAVVIILVLALNAFSRDWEADAPRTGLAQRAFIVPGCLWIAGVFLHFAST
ncbi:DUF998 domain-containing protein [Zhihengliuella halotolerans]|uniref:Uncharacterized protein DUF998 n=1 Tax=Zhihengliuella halotolerans TaxID=370736 RepID=A0A4V2GA41_9MICC|nr:DUF998 domain-containing protein [Zhihengliuella halotolerans]RZU62766.1 uncharacterized protein DUF998 [Zhihengliuella halotolerans]